MLNDFVAPERDESRSIALPHSLWENIDAKVEELKRQAPHLKINRSNFIENAIRAYFDAAKRKKQ